MHINKPSTTLLKHTLAHAAKWSALAEIANKGLIPVVFLVLAYSLTPQDFGIIAIGMMAISLAQVFWEAGLNKALIQRQDNIEKVADIVFWTNLGLAIIIYSAIFLSADRIATILHEPLAGNVLKIQSVQILISAVSSVHIALLQKSLNFKLLFKVKLVSSAVLGGLSVFLAFYGFGYWALVGGLLGSAIVQAGLLWRLSAWCPRFDYDTTVALGSINFGLWISAENLLVWCIQWIDAFIVAAYLTSSELGLYRTGTLVATVVFTIIIGSLLPILFSGFSRLQHSKTELRNGVLRAIKAVNLITIPLGLGLACTAPFLEALIFTDEWAGISTVIFWMGAMQTISWMVAVNMEAYRAMGRPDLPVKIMLICLGYYIPFYLLGIRYGFEAFLITRFLLGISAIFFHIMIAKKYLDLSWLNILAEIKWFVFASVVMVVYIESAKSGLAVNYLQITTFLILVVGGGITYFLSLYPERKFIIELLNMFLYPKNSAL